MLENAQKQGAHIMKRLAEMKESHPMIGDIRGLGLMCGLELVKDKRSKVPAQQETEEVMMECFRKGIALVNCGKSVIRLMPPLPITRDLVDRSLDVLDETIGALEKTRK